MTSFTSCKRCASALFVAGCMGLFSLAAIAQDSSSSSSQTTDPQAQKPPETPVRPNQDVYAVSLGTGQVINLNGDQPGPATTGNDSPASSAEYADGLRMRSRGQDFNDQFFYGLSVASIYTSSYGSSTQGTTAVPSTLTSALTPFVGLLIPTKTGSYLAQYSAIVTPDPNGQGPQAYHSFGLAAQGAFSRRLFWVVSGQSNYGSELARDEGSLGYSAVSGVPVVNANAAVLFPTNNVIFGGANFGLTWLESQRNRIGWTGFYDYSGIEGLHNTPFEVGNHDNAIGTTLTFGHTVNSRVELRAYGLAETLLNGPLCDTVGGGVGVSARLSHSVFFDAQGGPSRNSSGCGGQQNYNFNASLVKGLRNGDRIYANGGRSFTTAFQTTGYWEDTATAGFAKNLRRVVLIGETGFVRGAPVTGAAAYEGYFFSPRLEYRINRSMDFSAGYRAFRATGGNLGSASVSFAVVSIDWHPAPIHFKK